MSRSPAACSRVHDAAASASRRPVTFPLLLKPAGARCNLRCAYCFYLEKQALYPGDTRMSEATLEQVTRSFLAMPMQRHVFIWQGGEPLLMGLGFYRLARDLQTRYAVTGTPVENVLQTNGTLLTDEWAEFLARERFLVGVSLDGPAALHDAFRTGVAGAGSHARVLEGLACLERAKATVNILTLVSRANARSAAQVFEYLAGLGQRHHQYIPCLEHDASGTARPFSLDAAAWGGFLCDLYDAWVRRGDPDVSIRFFDAVLDALLGGVARLCHMGGSCRQYFVVEHNGDIYPCDFFVSPDLRLGNVHRTTWPEALEAPVFQRFGKNKGRAPARCRECAFVRFCHGDCPRHRPAPGGKSRLCEGYKAFFRHALPGLGRMAEQIRNHGRLILDGALPSPIDRPTSHSKGATE